MVNAAPPPVTRCYDRHRPRSGRRFHGIVRPLRGRVTGVIPFSGGGAALTHRLRSLIPIGMIQRIDRCVDPNPPQTQMFNSPGRGDTGVGDTALFGEPILLGKEISVQGRVMDRCFWGEMKCVPQTKRLPAVRNQRT